MSQNEDIMMKRMRKEIKKAYNNSPGWVDKVNKMSNAQAAAIYETMLTKKQVKNVW